MRDAISVELTASHMLKLINVPWVFSGNTPLLDCLVKALKDVVLLVSLAWEDASLESIIHNW